MGSDLLVRISCCAIARRSAALAAVVGVGAFVGVAPPAGATVPSAVSAISTPAQIASQNPPAGLGTTPESSYNWSGYVAQKGTQGPFTVVTMTYKQPAVTCPVAGGWTLFWTGFDGWDDNTVEQAGTAGQCVNGQAKPSYYGWWEMYPTNSIQPMGITIKPGDKIKTTVTYTASGARYSMTVSDLTDGQHDTQVAICQSSLHCLREDAEWIVERPTSNGVFTPLAKWNPFPLGSDQASQTTSGTPVLHPISTFPNLRVTMVNQSAGATLARVSALSSSGASFTSTFVKAQ